MLTGAVRSLALSALFSVMFAVTARTQTLPANSSVRYDSRGNIIPSTPGQRSGGDSLRHRNNLEDSITIYFRYFDSTRIEHLDSSVSDFTSRYPLPAHYVTLGNLGTAARSLIFNPYLKPGFDPGFHAFDVYRFTNETTRFYQTTRPYTELGYLLGSQAEQTINIIHTQNVRPNFNMAVQYRLINAPGNFQNQNTNANSYRINGTYQSRNKRYTVYGILLGNKMQASENGGIQNDSLLNDYRFTNRFVIPTRLSGDANLRRNFFSTRINTGNIYTDQSFLLRQQYDLGQSDSLIVNDSTVIRLFYPRLRFQHTFTLSKKLYEFRDFFEGSNKPSDYKEYFNVTLPGSDTLLFRDKWKVLQNDFDIISFPEKNNLNQFIRTGASVQNISGTFDSVNKSYYNIFLSGEYRNRSRNQKWDIEAAGKLYLAGLNSGDYAFQLKLKRLISKKLGYLEASGENINRSPSYLYSGGNTTFPVVTPGNFNKENVVRLGGSLANDARGTVLSGDYYLVSNYTYFDSFFTARQEGTLFNVLHLSAKKVFRLTRHLNFYSEVHLQKTAGNPPVQLPLIFTANRLALEGIYYKNMIYSIGLEVRYHTPYKADNYSPFTGQFFYQDGYRISNRPEVNAFFNFRIKTFKAFIRAENLNSLSTNTGSVGFNKNNLAAEHYPLQGFWFRLGIWWTFIN